MLFATLDFEASSLTGWPIEAGWMREGDTAPRSMLIRPEPMWSMEEWDAKAEAVHKIPIEALRRSISAPALGATPRGSLQRGSRWWRSSRRWACKPRPNAKAFDARSFAPVAMGGGGNVARTPQAVQQSI